MSCSIFVCVRVHVRVCVCVCVCAVCAHDPDACRTAFAHAGRVMQLVLKVTPKLRRRERLPLKLLRFIVQLAKFLQSQLLSTAI